MGGVSLGELAVAAVLCFVVLGAERTFRLLYALGRLFRKAQDFIASCRAQLDLPRTELKSALSLTAAAPSAPAPRTLSPKITAAQPSTSDELAKLRAEVAGLRRELRRVRRVGRVQRRRSYGRGH